MNCFFVWEWGGGRRMHCWECEGLWPGARFSKLPVITGPVKLFLFSILEGVSKGLKIVQ